MNENNPTRRGFLQQVLETLIRAMLVLIMPFLLSCARRRSDVSPQTAGTSTGGGSGSGGGGGASGTMTVLEATQRYVGSVHDVPYAGPSPWILPGTEGVISINGIDGGGVDPWAGNMAYIVDGIQGTLPAGDCVLGPGQHSIVWANAITGHTICSFTFLI